MPRNTSTMFIKRLRTFGYLDMFYVLKKIRTTKKRLLIFIWKIMPIQCNPIFRYM